MTITLPLRLITLHFSQIFFTDGFTFILSSRWPALPVYGSRSAHMFNQIQLLKTRTKHCNPKIVTTLNNYNRLHKDFKNFLS